MLVLWISGGCVLLFIVLSGYFGNKSGKQFWEQLINIDSPMPYNSWHDRLAAISLIGFVVSVLVFVITAVIL